MYASKTPKKLVDIVVLVFLLVSGATEFTVCTGTKVLRKLLKLQEIMDGDNRSTVKLSTDEAL